MVRALLQVLAAIALLSATVALLPDAAARHNCYLEDTNWQGPGQGVINPAIGLADRVCDGYHGHPCHGERLYYGWYGWCL